MAAPTERSLRITTLFSSIPSFILLCIAGLLSASIPCLLCLVPLVLSFVVSLIYVQRSPQQSRIALPTTSADDFADPQKPGPAWPFIDASIFIVYLGLLITLWATLGNIWGRDLVVVATYGSVSMLLNCFIHLYLFLGHFKWTTDCPRCGESLPIRRPNLNSRVTTGYSALGEQRDLVGVEGAVPQKGLASEEV